MFLYESNKSSAIKFVRRISPHIKSYTRLLSTSSKSGECSKEAMEHSSENDSHFYQSPERKNKDEKPFSTSEINRNVSEVKTSSESEHKGDPVCVCQPIAWSLITSSCLSKGTCDTVNYSTHTYGVRFCGLKSTLLHLLLFTVPHPFSRVLNLMPPFALRPLPHMHTCTHSYLPFSTPSGAHGADVAHSLCPDCSNIRHVRDSRTYEYFHRFSSHSS
jgi:hypothetical protein